jgi:hypothetical protein
MQNIRNEITPGGNCPLCNTRVRVENYPKKIYKGRLFITDYSNNEIEIKCPNSKCKARLVAHY